VIERSFRSFLECGIHRFGVVRFQCKKCGTDLFVALGYPAYCTSLDRVVMTGSVSADGLPGSS
jgi:transposase-like protein